jgi:dolichol kinase
MYYQKTPLNFKKFFAGSVFVIFAIGYSLCEVFPPLYVFFVAMALSVFMGGWCFNTYLKEKKDNNNF